MGSGETHSFEAKVEFVSAKSRLVDILLEGRFWLPKKCTIEMTDADPDGNCWFIVNHWWYTKREDFRVKEEEE